MLFVLQRLVLARMSGSTRLVCFFGFSFFHSENCCLLSQAQCSTGNSNVAEDDLELLAPLPFSPKCWGNRLYSHPWLSSDFQSHKRMGSTIIHSAVQCTTDPERVAMPFYKRARCVLCVCLSAAGMNCLSAVGHYNSQLLLSDENSLYLQTGFLAKLIFELYLLSESSKGLRERSHLFGEQLVCQHFYLLRHR